MGRRGSTPAEFFRYLSGTDTRIHTKIPVPEDKDGQPVEGLRHPRSARRSKSANARRKEISQRGRDSSLEDGHKEGQDEEEGEGERFFVNPLIRSMNDHIIRYVNEYEYNNLSNQNFDFNPTAWKFKTGRKLSASLHSFY